VTGSGASQRGFLITFEGPEGSGKTTLIKSLAAHMSDHGEQPLLVREPGGTAIGERVRNILLDMASGEMCAETELLLMVASRAQLVREKIQPALAAGLTIICDRFADASVAYQGHGRNLGVKTVNRINDLALAGLKPDLTFLCMIPPEEGRARLQRRVTDRLDHETVEFHQRVFEGYQAMADSGQSRFKVIDATGTPDEMFAAAVGYLKKLEHGLFKYL